MLFKKLFQVLVMGGAVLATASGCVQRAEAGDKKAAADGGAAADAGTKASSSGGGVKGW